MSNELKAMGSEPRWSQSRARATWVEGSHSRAFVREFGPFDVDEPPHAGGANTGPRPSEYVLMAYCGCTIVFAERGSRELGLRVSAMEVEARSTLDLRGIEGVGDITPCIQRIDATVRIKTSAAPDQVQQLRRWVERRCLMHQTLLRAGAEMNVEWVASEG